jgi:hypothetical protein
VANLCDADSAIRLQGANLCIDMTEQFAASRIHTERAITNC